MPANTPAWSACVAMLALVLFMPGVLNDGDSFSHVATGNWMIAHHQVLSTDPFSATRSGAPWVAHEWLAEILMAGAFRLAGWSGVVALTAAAAALAFYRLARHLARDLPGGAVLILLVLAAACVAPGMLARPHILALPVFEAWTAGLLLARSRRVGPSWHLVGLMCLWANLHGGFMIGLVLAVPLALEAMLEAGPGWRPVGLRWGGFLLSAVVACLATPHGLAGLLLPFRLSGMAELANVGEWRPTDFATLQPLELLVMIGLYLGLVRGARLAPLRLLIVLGLLHLALQHTRHLLLIGIIVPLLIAGPLGAALPRAADRRGGWLMRAGGLAAACLLLAWRLAEPIVIADGPTAPVSALAHVPDALRAQPVFNDYAFGGYLIWRGVRPFIDARAELYGPAFLARYAAIIHPDRAALQAVLRDCGMRWAILSPSNPVVSVFEALPGWRLVYGDRVAVVFTGRSTDPF